MKIAFNLFCNKIWISLHAYTVRNIFLLRNYSDINKHTDNIKVAYKLLSECVKNVWVIFSREHNFLEFAKWIKNGKFIFQKIWRENEIYKKN